MRKTKIICTLGPSSASPEMIRRLILAGMNAARFNFSHGSHESHLKTLNMLRNVRDELCSPVAAILDTKGPELRIGSFAEGSVELSEGDCFILSTEQCDGTRERVGVTYDRLHDEVKPGDEVLLDDGLISMSVTEVSGRDIRCTVKNGGVLGSSKSINLPGVKLSLPALTKKDREDIRFAAENDFDFVAASFVRGRSDMEAIRAALDEYGGQDVKIIAKIENREGVENIDGILELADGLMVARGDLGVEIHAYEVPVIQKMMIRKSSALGKPVITATQMLDSMIRNPRPTRAEVSDVANAVFDGTSCVMLSGETASGKYPVEALEIMVNTILAAEESIDYWGEFRRLLPGRNPSIPDAISRSCCLTAMELGAKAILAATKSGQTARVISRFKPQCPIAAMTMTEKVRRQLSICWGVVPFLSGSVDSTDRLFSLCVECARKEDMVSAGDTVVITAGVPIGTSGTTNLIKAQVISETRL